MKEIINERLKKISAYIYDNEKIIDIGCDHALLDIYLYNNRRNITVIASDINKKPLLIAKENILKYHLENKIILKQGNGLEVMEDDVDTVVISGMGAINIVNILKEINSYPHVSKLILSPNNDYPFLREEVSKLGFKIKQEEMVKENNKFYLISVFVRGNENSDYLFGKLDLKKDNNIEYFMFILKKNLYILNRINNNDSAKKKNLLLENEKIKKQLYLP